jgi:hypothetical protein
MWVGPGHGINESRRAAEFLKIESFSFHFLYENMKNSFKI